MDQKSPDWTRRDVLRIGFGATACAVSGLARPRKAAARIRPNILFLMADQHRGDCLGVDGNRAIRTPNLDRLANEGAHFRCGYSTTPSCTPARAALLTGMGPWNNGMLGYTRVGEKYPVEMPRVLSEAGYYTCGIGKMHWHPQRNAHGFHNMILDESGRAETPEFRSDYRAWFYTQAGALDPDATGIGFNDYRSKAYALPEHLHPTHWTGDTASNFIESYNRPGPFFLKVSFARPHSPYDPPRRFMDMYADADLPKRNLGDWCFRHAEKHGPEFSPWHGDFGADQVRLSRQGYYGSVSFVDEQIGRIVSALEKRGWLENTLILYISDHGDMTGDHHMWRKSFAYEPSARIPYIVRWPEGLLSAKRGQRIDAPVEIRDVLPTFVDAAQTTTPVPMDGSSLLPLIEGKANNWRPYIDLEHDICYTPQNHWSALTDGKWKYIFHCRDGEEQLFDLGRDPGELRDLAGDTRHTDALRKWRGRLIAHLEPRGDAFVKNGKLALRPESVLLSSNYPGCGCHPMAGEKGRKPAGA